MDILKPSTSLLGSLCSGMNSGEDNTRIVVKSMNLEPDCLDLNPIFTGPVGLPWASYLTFFCLNVLFSKIGIVTKIILIKLLTGLNELIY